MSEMILYEGGLEFRSTGDEPRIRDLDLAERLGYERPHEIRRLIERHSKKLGLCVTVTKSHGGRPGVEYWLTERQALFITTQSRTDRAADISMMLVDAFIAIRKQIESDRHALKSLPRRIVEMLLLPGPVEDGRDRMFEPSLVNAICELHGKKYFGGPHPWWIRSTYRKIYDSIFSSQVGAAIKERNQVPRWESLHWQHLKPEARNYLSAQLKVVEAIARQSGSKADFWNRMAREYAGGMLQLPMMAR